ncbi:MAG: hypothetical protein KF729_37540 [Sandaracinaceae bacterium]|nr:hypothetical protein [Sandaracinaceae bacterium]
MTESFVARVAQMSREVGLDELELGADEVRITVPREPAAVHVTVRACGEMHGKEVLEFSSDGLPLPREDSDKMPLLILALQRNADVIFGHWGLDEGDDGSTLRVFHSQITETMDPPELRGAVLAVADEYATLAGAFAELFRQR